MSLSYHELSKHGFDRSAPGPGGLDWATQPDPFRVYEGAETVALSRGPFPGGPDELISDILFHSMALSAWKEHGESRWALRVNPSSGNLHPTECYVIGAVAGRSGVHHYRPREHALELRAPLDDLGEGELYIGLTSILWREAWKYGERAYRYCQHDLGHAIAAVALAASARGLDCWLLELGSDELGALLGTRDPGDAEPEEPECLLALVPKGRVPSVPAAPASWLGRPNRLSPSHSHEWKQAQAMLELARSPAARGAPGLVRASAREEHRALSRRRRSAVDFDGKSVMESRDFFRILEATRARCALPWEARVSLGLFVHRVSGVAPGLYLFFRGEEDRSPFKREFDWLPVPDGPSGLYRLLEGDARGAAMHFCCHQNIASDGAFSVAMLTRFRDPIEKLGASAYPRLFWECGAVGQVLYLEAEATPGFRGTGIGCYFDDPTHALFGLVGDELQSLYHFTVGGPVDDARLRTEPAYSVT